MHVMDAVLKLPRQHFHPLPKSDQVKQVLSVATLSLSSVSLNCYQTASQSDGIYNVYGSKRTLSSAQTRFIYCHKSLASCHNYNIYIYISLQKVICYFNNTSSSLPRVQTCFRVLSSFGELIKNNNSHFTVAMHTCIHAHYKKVICY